MINIKTPTKQILYKMFSDEWITEDAIYNKTVSIELILMYQHCIIPLNEHGMDYHNFLFEKITIKGQIKAQENALLNCMNGENYKDYFFEGIAIMHKEQLRTLKNLQNLLIAQYN